MTRQSLAVKARSWNRHQPVKSVCLVGHEPTFRLFAGQLLKARGHSLHPDESSMFRMP